MSDTEGMADKLQVLIEVTELEEDRAKNLLKTFDGDVIKAINYHMEHGDIAKTNKQTTLEKKPSKKTQDDASISSTSKTTTIFGRHIRIAIHGTITDTDKSTNLPMVINPLSASSLSALSWPSLANSSSSSLSSLSTSPSQSIINSSERRALKSSNCGQNGTNSDGNASSIVDNNDHSNDNDINVDNNIEKNLVDNDAKSDKNGGDRAQIVPKIMNSSERRGLKRPNCSQNGTNSDGNASSIVDNNDHSNVDVNVNIDKNLVNNDSKFDKSDDVRAPIVPTRETMIDQSVEVQRFQRHRDLATQHVVPLRNFQVEAEIQEARLMNDAEQYNNHQQHYTSSNPGCNTHRTGTSTTAITSAAAIITIHESGAKRQRLEDLFRPPIDLIFNGPFGAARDYAKLNNRWLIINLQDSRIFESQLLNRDIWSHTDVQNIIRRLFIFWQVDVDSAEGSRCKIFYNVTEFPHVAIIDPRTGENKYTFEAVGKLSALEFETLLHKYISQYQSNPHVLSVMDMQSDRDLNGEPSTSIGLKLLSELTDIGAVPSGSSNGNVSTKKSSQSVIDATEEDQLRMAIENSLLETHVNGSKVNALTVLSSDEDDDIDDVDINDVDINDVDINDVDINDVDISCIDEVDISDIDDIDDIDDEDTNKDVKNTVKKNTTNLPNSVPLASIPLTGNANTITTTSNALNTHCSTTTNSANNTDRRFMANNDVIIIEDDSDCEILEAYNKYLGNFNDEHTKIVVRFPNGTKELIDWPCSSKLRALKLYMKENYPIWTFDNSYKLLCTFPERLDIQKMDDNQTLKMANLHPSATLYLHLNTTE